MRRGSRFVAAVLARTSLLGGASGALLGGSDGVDFRVSLNFGQKLVRF
ncbi:MAG TPA: hypothetical protein VKG01_05745 [Thermoanaerobaculia bacterium]|nr:hypothetical protein [Thermoanaerobaculia bacterium]